MTLIELAQAVDIPSVDAAPREGLFAYLFFAVGGAVAIGHAIHAGVRKQQWIPLLLVLGGALAVTAEPLYDIWAKIIYRPTFFGFDAFGLETPGYLFLGYLLWVATVPWIMHQKLKEGMSGRTLYLVAAGVFISVVFVDIFGHLTDHWRYYGDGPFAKIAGSFSMGPFPIIGGWLLYVLEDRVRGAAKLLYILVPGVLLNLAFACISWPTFFALNTELSLVAELVATAISVVLALSVVWFVDTDLEWRRRAHVALEAHDAKREPTALAK